MQHIHTPRIQPQYMYLEYTIGYLFAAHPHPLCTTPIYIYLQIQRISWGVNEHQDNWLQQKYIPPGYNPYPNRCTKVQPQYTNIPWIYPRKIRAALPYNLGTTPIYIPWMYTRTTCCTTTTTLIDIFTLNIPPRIIRKAHLYPWDTTPGPIYMYTLNINQNTTLSPI